MMSKYHCHSYFFIFIRVTLAIFANKSDILNGIYGSDNLIIKPTFVGPNFEIIKNGSDVTFQCRNIFSSEIKSFDHEIWTDIGYKHLIWPPPTQIPELLLQSYTLDGYY